MLGAPRQAQHPRANTRRPTTTTTVAFRSCARSLVLLIVLFELSANLRSQLDAPQSLASMTGRPTAPSGGVWAATGQDPGDRDRDQDGDSYGSSVAGSSPRIEAALQADEDDDDEDDELNAELEPAASGDYQDDVEPDESIASYGPTASAGDEDDYADADSDADEEDERAQESRQVGWLARPPPVRLRRHQLEQPGDPEADAGVEFGRRLGGRPATKLQASGRRDGDQDESPSSTATLDTNRDEDFAIDDGDEDAWVHDGIDDIRIDPETRRAASELARDSHASADDDEEAAEDEPAGLHRPASEQSPRRRQQQQQQRQSANLAEVIPIRGHSNRGRQSSGQQAAAAAALLQWPDGRQHFLPAAYLTLEQVQQLVAGQQLGPSQRRRADDYAIDDDHDEEAAAEDSPNQDGLNHDGQPRRLVISSLVRPL